MPAHVAIHGHAASIDEVTDTSLVSQFCDVYRGKFRIGRVVTAAMATPWPKVTAGRLARPIRYEIISWSAWPPGRTAKAPDCASFYRDMGAE